VIEHHRGSSLGFMIVPAESDLFFGAGILSYRVGRNFQDDAPIINAYQRFAETMSSEVEGAEPKGLPFSPQFCA
jgi:hypothetical protein